MTIQIYYRALVIVPKSITLRKIIKITSYYSSNKWSKYKTTQEQHFEELRIASSRYQLHTHRRPFWFHKLPYSVLRIPPNSQIFLSHRDGPRFRRAPYKIRLKAGWTRILEFSPVVRYHRRTTMKVYWIEQRTAWSDRWSSLFAWPILVCSRTTAFFGFPRDWLPNQSIRDHRSTLDFIGSTAASRNPSILVSSATFLAALIH